MISLIHHALAFMRDCGRMNPTTPSGPQEEVQPLVVRLPVDMHAELKERARDDDLSMSQVVRRAIREYLRDDSLAPV